jgi:hypothetical protein
MDSDSVFIDYFIQEKENGAEGNKKKNCNANIRFPPHRSIG